MWCVLVDSAPDCCTAIPGSIPPPGTPTSENFRRKNHPRKENEDVFCKVLYCKKVEFFSSVTRGFPYTPGTGGRRWCGGRVSGGRGGVRRRCVRLNVRRGWSGSGGPRAADSASTSCPTYRTDTLFPQRWRKAFSPRPGQIRFSHKGDTKLYQLLCGL